MAAMATMAMGGVQGWARVQAGAGVREAILAAAGRSWVRPSQSSKGVFLGERAGSTLWLAVG